MHGIPAQFHGVGAMADGVFLSTLRSTGRRYGAGMQDGCHRRFSKSDAVDGWRGFDADREGEVEEHLKDEMKLKLQTRLY